MWVYNIVNEHFREPRMTFITSFDTGLHADCVRFVPNFTSQNEEIAIFSCYELNESTNKRLGRLILGERLGNEV